MIRSYTAEDADYIIESHYAIYNKEYQYDHTFKAFIAESVNGFIKRNNSKENIWILEVEGAKKGSISIKQVDDKAAQLGLFLVDPSLRGKSYGKQLIQQAIAFCVDNRYETMLLWTNQELSAARILYERHGFHLKETRTSFLSNQSIQEEMWELSLKPLSS